MPNGLAAGAPNGVAGVAVPNGGFCAPKRFDVAGVAVKPPKGLAAAAGAPKGDAVPIPPGAPKGEVEAAGAPKGEVTVAWAPKGEVAHAPNAGAAGEVPLLPLA